MKKKSQAKLKKDLDKVFSQYIRLKYADQDGNVDCYTCGKTMNWKEAHCGHFVSRTHLATRFDERNTRVQCVGCNIFGNGQTAVFAGKLEDETKGIVSELYRKAREITKYYPYEAKIEYYKKLVKEME